LAPAALCLLAVAAQAEPIAPTWSVTYVVNTPAVALSDQGAAAGVAFTLLPAPTHTGDGSVDLVGFQAFVADPAAGPFTFSRGGIVLGATLTDHASGESWTDTLSFRVFGNLAPGRADLHFMSPAILYLAQLGGYEYAITHAGRLDPTRQGLAGALGIHVTVSPRSAIPTPEPSALALATLGAALGAWCRAGCR
jgi:hypothetical protein